MKKALIIYNSKKGTTKRFGNEIGNFLHSKNIESKVIPIYEFDEKEVKNYDMILLGCWTSGFFIVGQHPRQDWIDFSKRLPNLRNKKVGLFTTYKLATGTMFKKMKEHLKEKVSNISFELKSRNGMIGDAGKSVLLQFIN